MLDNWSTGQHMSSRVFRFYAQPRVTVSNSTNAFYHQRVQFYWGNPVIVCNWTNFTRPTKQELRELFITVEGDLDTEVLQFLQTQLFPGLTFAEIQQTLEENGEINYYRAPANVNAPPPAPKPDDDTPYVPVMLDEKIQKRLAFLKHQIETSGDYDDDLATLPPSSDE